MTLEPVSVCPTTPQQRDDGDATRVVIVGAGFAGLAAAKALAHAPTRVTVIDRQNHHVFQPLLYQVATAALAPTQIATPVRTILRKQGNAEVILGEVVGVDLERKQVLTADRRVAFDYLILATGARHAYFGHDDWEHHAPGLKTIDDATALRSRILLAFERAEVEEDEAERARLLTFVIVGGGPTGVETAGAVAELAKRALRREYRRINPQCARIILLEAGQRLLSAFPDDLSASALAAIERLGVEVRLNTAVTGIDAATVALRDGVIPTRCVIWAAGVQASPAAKWLGATADRAGRTLVGPDLRIVGRDDVFVIGDCAYAIGADGKPLPGIAPVAKQQGAYAARAIKSAIRGEAVAPFTYVDFGAMATVGRKAAIAELRGLRLKGFVGWLTWCAAHIYFLIGFRNRIAVAFDWIWSFLTFERGGRLILAQPAQRMEASPSREAA